MGLRGTLSSSDRNKLLLGAALVGGTVLGGILIYRRSYRASASQAGPTTDPAQSTLASPAAVPSDGRDTAGDKDAPARKPQLPTRVVSSKPAAASSVSDPPAAELGEEVESLSQLVEEAQHVRRRAEFTLQKPYPAETTAKEINSLAADAKGNGPGHLTSTLALPPPPAAAAFPSEPLNGSATQISTAAATGGYEQPEGAPTEPPAEGKPTAPPAVCPEDCAVSEGLGLDAASDETSQAPQDEGGAGASVTSQLNYTWYQDEYDVFLHVSAAGVEGARDVSVNFGARSLRMAVRGQPVVEGKLTEAVHPDECTWQFEEVRGERRVLVTLTKASKGLWRSVIQGDPPLDLQALAAVSGFSDRKHGGVSPRLPLGFEE